MIERLLETALRRDAAYAPVVTLTGPRQSGKSTLARTTFPDHVHVSLERPDVRAAAEQDPRSVLAQGATGIVLDEVQRVPSLLSWIQVAVDEDPRPGRFVLTGSNQHALSAGVAQTLAGRTTVLNLLPPDLEELRRFPTHPTRLWETLHTGAFPRIHDTGIPADRWLASYVATYLERDVRQIMHVSDVTTFQTFVRLCAGRTSQELNLSSLGADAGVSQPTARGWLSVLETSFLAQRVPAFHHNIRKQLVKAPKLHLVDTGLTAWLLGIRSASELATHPLRGAIFETWVATEIVKQRYHRALPARLSHWRESRGVEIDLVVDDGATLWLVEAKSGATIASDWFGPLRSAVATLADSHRDIRPVIVYGGDEPARRHDIDVVPWHMIGRLAPEA